jgi:AraC-like DNA-binding protein
MLRHPDKPLRISALSEMTGYSGSYLFVLFKSATGYAPKKFFIRVRMERACKMLSVLTVSVKQVAAALGYEDEFYFSRLFKSVIGIAPRDYRRKLIASTKSPTPHEGCRAVKVKAMSI